MVGRSLVTKTYLYAVATLVVIVGLAIAATHALMDQGRLEGMGQFHRDLAVSAGIRYEWALADGVIAADERARLEELGRHAAVRRVAWAAQGEYPAALAREKVVTVRHGHAPWQQSFWVRVDARGAPDSALHVALRPLHRPRRLPLAPLLFGGVLALVTIPPLYLFVIRPLRRMSRVAHRLGEGDLQTPVVVDRRDEFGELQQAFERMRTQILAMLEGRDRLLRDISHELRGPLSRMAIALPLLKEEHGEDPTLAQLEREVAAMDALIGEVLALARGQAPGAIAREPLDLAEVASEVLAERAIVLAGRALALEEALAPAPATGDRRLLARALGNLLDNAIKYTPDPGTIALATGTEDGEAFFRVTDTGPGIAPEHLPRIFDPFYRPDDSRSRETGGTGLGLSIAKAIAEGHGGRVAIASAPGQGTTAEVRLSG